MTTGRYAPSPTGSLHLGNLRTAVAAWASARARGGRFLLRIEDLDRARCRTEFEARQLADLAALGMTWDETPLRQSERDGVYAEMLATLVHRRMAYPCFCSRKEIAETLSAPHGPSSNAYQGTCRNLPRAEAQARIDAGERHAWRLRIDQAPPTFFDGFRGEVAMDLTREGGDFVLRRADGFFSYQLACAVDDALSGVDEVVRGDDLLDSGARQAYLLACLGLPVPRYIHIPLLRGEDGQRLAKRIGSADLQGTLARGYDVSAVVGYLAFSLGQAAPGERLSLAQVAERWDPRRVPREPAIFREADLQPFRQGA